MTTTPRKMAYTSAIERLPDELRQHIDSSLRATVSTTEILRHLADNGHPEITRRQLQLHKEKYAIAALDTAGKTLRAVSSGKLTLSSDDALLSVLADALEQIDRLGTLVRSQHNSRLERILADSYPSIFNMLKEVSFDAGELQRVRGLEARQGVE